MQKAPYNCAFRAEIIHPGQSISEGATGCTIGKHIKFDTDGLQTYVQDVWQPIIYDAMLLAAAVEVCDLTRPRAKMDWSREFTVVMPVHEPNLWNSHPVNETLVRALKMLTGDNWRFDFCATEVPQAGPNQQSFGFPHEADTVIPFSDGLDSQSVAEIMAHSRADRMIRVRVGANKISKPKVGEAVKPFANVPFTVKRALGGNGESSGRSRGFKFAMLSGLAAYLIGADTVIVPESGQGALGPVLVNVGQGYFDRRTHPQYTTLMSDFFETLFGKRIAFEHPMIWGTKGESVTAYKALKPDEPIWRNTRSCWKDARHASLNGDHRQCGVCAACMLRRTSLHAAGYQEAPDSYIWEDLAAPDFWAGAHSDYDNRNGAQRDYGIAGVLHMDHLAALRNSIDRDLLVQRQALPLARVLGLSFDEAAKRIVRLIEAHADEWSGFVGSLPRGSFVREWAKAA